MLQVSRVSLGALAVLTLLMLGPTSASAAFWPSFPFPPSSEATLIGLPGPASLDLCKKTMTVAGISVRALLPCKETPPPPPVQPTLDFAANPSTIEADNSSTLTWDSTNADSCTASNGWAGNKSVDGNESVSPAATTSYTLTCSNANGFVAKTVTVTVTAAPVAPTLTLVKTVTNDDGGTAVANDFQAKIDGTNVAWSAAHDVTVGSHTVSETGVAGYTSGVWGGDCAADGTITLAAGENRTCTITNNDQPGVLIVQKVLVKDNGGTANAEDFSFQVNGGAAVTFEVDGHNQMEVDAGTYSVVEVAAEGYTTTYENCTDVAISNGEIAICTITNNDNAPAPTTGHLVVDKVTQPGSDSTEFAINASGTGTITGGGAGMVTDATGKDYEVAAGTYSVAETVPTGWTIVSNTCVDVVVAAGETKNCTITNAKLPTLTLNKTVTNDNSGSATANDFQAKIDGANVAWGVAETISIGAHTASETSLAGYTASDWGGDCAANGTISLAAGENKTCSITNDDDPVQGGALLITEVLYDVGAGQGVETTNEWVEIHNGTGAPIDLTGYTLADNTSSEAIPNGTVIPAGGTLVLTPGSDTGTLWSIPAEKVVVLAGSIGNGLALNDHVKLMDASATLVDGVSWGTDTDPLNPGAASVAEGSSLARTPVTTDTNAAADWTENATPTPGS